MNPIEWAAVVLALWMIAGLVVVAFFAALPDPPDEVHEHVPRMAGREILNQASPTHPSPRSAGRAHPKQGEGT